MLRPDVRLGVVDERLGAVAALQQERLAAGDLGQLAVQPVDLGRHRHRRHALQHRAHRARPGRRPSSGCCAAGLASAASSRVPQVVGQRRQRRQLVDRYVDGPVHPSMVTGRTITLAFSTDAQALTRVSSRRTSSAGTAAGCAGRRPVRRGRRAAAAASAGDPRSSQNCRSSRVNRGIAGGRSVIGPHSWHSATWS